ncbi:MAG: glucose-6-phosphate isomerase [Capsulimonadales bacterium]|nr:glucose-6-phosphate isomerase [Capsulimonadales bacterium]
MPDLPLSLDAAYLAPNVTPAMVAAWKDRLKWASDTLLEGTGAGADFRGWLDPGTIVREEEIAEIESIAADLRAKTDTLVVIGIGGSYLGARAVIEALAPTGGPRVVFAGQNLSARYHHDLLAELRGKRVAVNVVSKSGTTTEPAVAFRLLRQFIEENAGKDAARNLIVATTDGKKGALRKVATEVGYRTLVIADDVGGRYSVLSPVGLLPIAYAGIDIRALLRGASDCAAAADEPDPLKNPVLFYAAARNLLYRQGFTTEILVGFEPRLHYLIEWWKQLFGESEGKDHCALFPASVEFTTDLHSMGQYIQEGRRMLIETFVTVADGEPEVLLPEGDDADELGYLAGQPLTSINRAAYEATALAHRDGGVPNLTLTLNTLDAHSLGFLLYFFERACGVSGYLLGINPFDQPGVEAYKKNMFALLGKPGHEARTEELKRTVAGKPADSRIRFD